MKTIRHASFLVMCCAFLSMNSPTGAAGLPQFMCERHHYDQAHGYPSQAEAESAALGNCSSATDCGMHCMSNMSEPGCEWYTLQAADSPHDCVITNSGDNDAYSRGDCDCTTHEYYETPATAARR